MVEKKQLTDINGNLNKMHLTTAIINAGRIAKTLLFACFPLAICIFIRENYKHKNGSLRLVLD